MSDDGTKAAKQIAFSIQLEGVLAQAAFLAKEMIERFEWDNERSIFLARLKTHIKWAREDASNISESFYKVIGEGG